MNTAMNIQEAHARVVEKLGINIDNIRNHRNFLNDNIDVIQQHFQMRIFYRTSEGNHPASEMEAVRKMGLDVDCGSAMCVVGWAPSNPDIAKEIDWDNDDGHWEPAINVFISNEGEVNLFSYLFGSDWDDDVDLAVERMDYVIEAAENPNEDNLRFLCAAANNELAFDDYHSYEDGYPVQDSGSPVVDGLYDYHLRDWVQSVMENQFITEIV